MSNLDQIADKLLQQTSLPDVDFDQYYEAHEDDKQGIKRVVDYFNEMETYANGGDELKGATLPFVKTHEKFRFRSGEVTMWSGYNGHKKSMMLSYCWLDFIRQRERVCVASFEMKPISTIVRMARQLTHQPKITENELADLMAFCGEELYIFDRMGGISPSRIFGVILYCAREKSVKHFVIDSLMRVVAGEDSYNAQKDFVVQLCKLAIEQNIHIHLVHHVRDGDETKVPSRYNAKGSKSLGDNVHNSLIVWSNKHEIDGEPDVVLKCDKQREGEWEGKLAIDFDKTDLTFSEKWT